MLQFVIVNVVVEPDWVGNTGTTTGSHHFPISFITPSALFQTLKLKMVSYENRNFRKRNLLVLLLLHNVPLVHRLGSVLDARRAVVDAAPASCGRVRICSAQPDLLGGTSKRLRFPESYCDGDAPSGVAGGDDGAFVAPAAEFVGTALAF